MRQMRNIASLDSWALDFNLVLSAELELFPTLIKEGYSEMLCIVWTQPKLQHIKLESQRGELELELLKHANLFPRRAMKGTTAVPVIFPAMG